VAEENYKDIPHACRSEAKIPLSGLTLFARHRAIREKLVFVFVLKTLWALCEIVYYYQTVLYKKLNFKQLFNARNE
jgi:hypothetical protein